MKKFGMLLCTVLTAAMLTACGNGNGTEKTTEAKSTTAEVVTTVADTTVAYFSEAEDIEGGVACTTGNANARCSNGTGAYFEADTTVTTQFSLCLTPYLTLDRILNVILITLLINDRDICNMQYI